MSRLNDLGPGVDKLENLIGSDFGKPSKGPRLDNRRLILFAMLYAVQGVVISYFITYNGRYMRASGFTDPSRPEGLSITQVGWSQTIATLPLAIKFLFGLWADRHNFLNFGHRKPYIILGLILQGISLFGISMINPVRHLSAFTLVATMAVAGLCLYDVACDAFAVQVTPKNDRSRVQGILQATRFISTAICGLVFGFIWSFTTIPGQGVLWLCGVLPLPAILYAIRIAEPEHRREGKGIGWGTFHIFRKKSLWALQFFSIIYAVVSFGVESVLSFWFAVPALAFTEQALGTQSLGRNCGRAVGALAQSRLSQFLSRRNLVVLGLVGLSVHTILFAFITGQTTAMIVGILFGISVGWLDALACSMAMDESDPDWPGSSFALIMAFQNLGTLGSGLMSTLADSQGFKAAFLIVAAINIFAIAAWPWLDHKHKKPTTDEVWSV